MKKYLIIAGLLIAISAVAVYFYTFKKPARTAANEEAVYTVSVKDITAEFETSEDEANTKYLNKVIKVYGTVSNVSESENDISVTLSEKESTSGVTCSFEKKDFNKTKVSPGQLVYIKGICSGYLMDVVLNKCALDTGTPEQ